MVWRWLVAGLVLAVVLVGSVWLLLETMSSG
jgi:hypothetical protein